MSKLTQIDGVDLHYFTGNLRELIYGTTLDVILEFKYGGQRKEPRKVIARVQAARKFHF